jgi:hypothetical protein
VKHGIRVGVSVVVLLAGCGAGSDELDTVSVTGTVYVDDEPHGPASIILYPNEGGRPTVTGVVAEDGSYTLTTYDEGDGAPPGDYTAQLSGAGSGDPADPDAMMSMMGTGPRVEPVTVTIPEGGSENVEIRLKSVETSGSTSSGSTLLGE